jgi:sugar phosphate permease
MSKFYPWVIAVIGMMTMTFSNGLTATGISVFDPALLDTFGWSRAELKFRDPLTFWPSALTAPIVGILVDRMNPKYLLIFGLSCLSVGLFGYSVLEQGAAVPLIVVIIVLSCSVLAGFAYVAIRTFLPALPRTFAIAGLASFALAAAWQGASHVGEQALYQTYAIHLLFSVVLSCAGGPVVLVLVSSWAHRHRGLAIGIALVGTSLGSALLPVVNAALIEAEGWRYAMRIGAILPIIGVLIVLLFVRGLPQQAQGAANEAQAPVGGFTFAEAIRTRAFWAICASGFLTYAAIFGVLQHLVLHMTKGLGFSLPAAAQLLLMFSTVAMAAKLVGGALADRIDRHAVFLTCLGIMLFGTVLLATMKEGLVQVAVVTIALGWGGLFTLYNLLAVNNFGLREIGRILGTIIFFESIGTGLGSWMTGRLFDLFGSYEAAFSAIAVTLALSLLTGSQTQVRSRAPIRTLERRSG